MVLRCAWGTCNSDERYPERMQGCKLIPFPKPKTNLDKCLRWIKACGRPHRQLNVERINKHKAVCTKHFVGENGPTDEYPDPVQADGSVSKPVRKRLKRNRSEDPKRLNIHSLEQDEHFGESTDTFGTANFNIFDEGTSTQTEEQWVSPLDLLTTAAEVHNLTTLVDSKSSEIKSLESKIQKITEENKLLKEENIKRMRFGVESVLNREAKIKGLFKYYTALEFDRFSALFSFLMPAGFSPQYEQGRTDIKNLSQRDCLFLVLVRLRHNFGLRDIAMRFELSLQSAGSIFNTWIDHMNCKFGQVSIWPHRDIIIENMPKEFRKDFPNTLIIIDGTEIKTQTPCSLGLQSQLYSDYKSNTTLKALIGCDPNGSVTFISELFTGSISDKAITEQSGFYDVLTILKSHGYIKDGDAIMADKGFTIQSELKEIGLKLNIPPFSASESQMSIGDTFKTNKIAKHRVHIERLISKVKTYQILSNTIPTFLFQSINKIWTICCFLTLFQDTFVSDKTSV